MPSEIALAEGIVRFEVIRGDGARGTEKLARVFQVAGSFWNSPDQFADCAGKTEGALLQIVSLPIHIM